MWRYPVGDGAKRTRTGELIQISRTTDAKVTKVILMKYPRRSAAATLDVAQPQGGRRCARPTIGNSRCASLDEELPGAATQMTITRKIYFCRTGFGIEKRPDRLDQTKTDVTRSVITQPTADRAALQCDRLFA